MTTPIFVFGSNLAGRHGKGAALFARLNRGAQYGVGEGHTGNSYALPTCDGQFRGLGLLRIKGHVDKFLNYAANNPHLTFEVTKVGCGLAGYNERQIAPLFHGAPPNCILPPGWRS